MRLRRWLLAGALMTVAGCQAAVPAVPAPTPSAPTVAPVPTPLPAPSAVASPRAVVSPSPTGVPVAVTASRVDTLNAANVAFGKGDLKTAAGLYDRVINTPPGSAEAVAASAAITDFARFRGLITLLADGREAEARTNLDELQKRDPNAPLARLGSQLFDQYGMTGQLRGACAQLQPQIASQAGPTLATLQGLGVIVDAPTLCSVPQG